MLTIQQWIIYALAGFVLFLFIALGIQTVRLSSGKKDVTTARQETIIAKGKIDNMVATMKQMAIIGDNLQLNYNKAQEQAQEVDRKNKALAEKLSSASVPVKCQDAVEWGRVTAKTIEEGW